MANPLPTPKPRRLLFVCSGNICRSPLAEALFRDLAAAEGLGHRFELDSAGTHDFHEGDQADPRTRRVAKRHGVTVDSIARPVEDSDFRNFDLILAMDRGHLRELRARAPQAERDKIRLMRDFDEPGKGADVPDPYYGGEDGFEEIFGMLSTCCRNLLNALR
ncbi:MAG: low molecular weight protein-tyrosine-phosphatase [Vicinamibacteria bacterium]